MGIAIDLTDRVLCTRSCYTGGGGGLTSLLFENQARPHDIGVHQAELELEQLKKHSIQNPMLRVVEARALMLALSL
jgi:hypothetical protein